MVFYTTGGTWRVDLRGQPPRLTPTMEALKRRETSTVPVLGLCTGRVWVIGTCCKDLKRENKRNLEVWANFSNEPTGSVQVVCSDASPHIPWESRQGSNGGQRQTG